MASVELYTEAEQKAEKIEEIDEFNEVNLRGIKSEVAEILDQIGTDGIFDEYTKHDINHINGMLEILGEEIIPEDTKEVMTTSDWFMTVLAIYFHDVGLLVTSDEFDGRGSTDFDKFVQQNLYTDDDEGKDYKARVEAIEGEGRKERFLYQEFVRTNHAERIKSWIKGDLNESIGGDERVIDSVTDILDCLPDEFRIDLARVCESHNKKDLGDTEKYSTSQPYGGSKETFTNLQYCAILLRTADLLHITSDRAPTTAFRIINPSEPKGQREWAKQEAVYNIRREQLPDDSEEELDTIEVYARFDEAEGYFALSSYLNYAEEQIGKCHDWVAESSDEVAGDFRYPWEKIDRSGINTEGFERENFEFTLDQERILELLTGHTLYNNTNVVVRELVQNSIDAVRLKEQKSSKKTYRGKITVRWSSDDETLEVIDNGTGMTQQIIEDHLLTVGSSRYQEEGFVETHPDFNAISEFGIGILSTFMIAGGVKILTLHEDDDVAREIEFRDVNNQYLINHIDKDEPEADQVSPHGTIVRLELRPSAEIEDIEAVCKHWFVCPPCPIELVVDGEIVDIGHEGIKAAVENYISEYSENINPTENPKIDLKEKSRSGINVCFATVESDYFDDWRFLEPGTRNFTYSGDDQGSLGISIEGIRITDETPGFDGREFIAMANLKGSQRPKTNVARTGLKSGDEFKEVLRTIYDLYLEHVEEEVNSLYQDRDYSRSWAVRAASYIMNPLRINDATNPEVLVKSISETPLILVETNSGREVVSLSKAKSFENIWTVDSPLFRRSDRLFRDMSENLSYRKLLSAFDISFSELPSDPIVCESHTSYGPKAVIEDREPAKISILEEEKRVDIMWDKDVDKWVKERDHLARLTGPGVNQYMSAFLGTRMRQGEQYTLIQKKDINREGAEDKTAIVTAGYILLLNNSPIHDYILSEAVQNDTPELIDHVCLSLFAHIAASPSNHPKSETQVREYIQTTIDDVRKRERAIEKHSAGLYKAISETEWDVFNPSVWFERFDS